MKDNQAFDEVERGVNETTDDIANDTIDDIVNNTDDIATKEVAPESSDYQLLYRIDQHPPWYLCILLGFQHYLTMFGATIGVPFILSTHLCYSHDPLIISEIISTIFFASGLATLLQTTFGVRLPIVQGGTFAFIAPTIAIMALKGKCPDTTTITATTNSTSATQNSTNIPADAEWQIRMRELQGAIMVSSLFQIVIGFSGMLGFMLKYIGPLTIAPTISLVGLPLFDAAAYYAGAQWGVALATILCITLFSQVLKNVHVPVPTYKQGCTTGRLQIFKLFPILLAILVSWALSGILTASGALDQGTRARTDYRIDVLSKSPWFRFPYPGQWGIPTLSAASVFGMVAGVLASMVESVGDYYACARLSGAPPPPRHAINRGLGCEGLGCLLAGAWGSGNGTTSYSENIGAIGITRVGSVRTIQFGALIMIILSLIGKFGAIFSTIPDPIIGGIFVVMFGMITAVGLSALQFVHLDSVRNLFVVGFSLFFGLVLPHWAKAVENHKKYSVGNVELDQIIQVLLSTNMFVGGLTGFLLDNLLPGTDDERGISRWQQQKAFGKEERITHLAPNTIYDVPLITPCIGHHPICKYIPFLPYYSRHTKDGGVEMGTNAEDPSA